MEPDKLASRLYDPCFGVMFPVYPVYVVLACIVGVPFLVLYYVVRGATIVMKTVDESRSPRWAKAVIRRILGVRLQER